MALRILFLGIVILVKYQIAFSQQMLERIKIGDAVPNLFFNDVYNYKENILSLSDFKGKLIIIDVWNKWCSSCISAFPKMERLQEEFKDKIQIILLTSDTRSDFEKIRERSGIIKETKLPIIVNDKSIDRLFPHQGVPLHIWIDTDNIAKAITSGYSTTSNSIKQFLIGNSIDFNRRDEEYLDFNPKTSLLFEGGGRQMKYLQGYSLFMTSLPGYKFSDFGYFNDTISGIKTAGAKFVNQSLKMLLLFAYRNKNISLEFEGGDKYLYPERNEDAMNEYVRDYKFCYEQYLPEKFLDTSLAIKEKMIVTKMKSDIENFFQFDIKTEERKLNCLNLIKIGELKFKNEYNFDKTLNEVNKEKWTMIGVGIDAFLSNASVLMGLKGFEVLNKTGYDGFIDMKLVLKDFSLSSVNDELKKYNLKVEISTVNLPVTVVRKKTL